MEEVKNKGGRPKGSKDKKPRVQPKRRYSGLSRKEIIKELRDIKKRKVDLYETKAEYYSSHKWAFHKPFKWQASVPDRVRSNLIVLAPAPNGIGKTVEMVCVLCSWLEGYEAWNEVDEFYPGAVRVGKKFYKQSSIGHAPPVKIRLTGEDWNHHLGQVVVPALKEWFPMENYDTKRNTNGIEYFWTHKKNGSTLELMTHTQDIKLFEGWRGNGWVADEPPPYEVFKPMVRGLAENHGKTLLFSTPLKEAWMLDELIRTNRSDTAVIKDLLLYDNEVSYENDNTILEGLGVPGKVTRYWRESDGAKKKFFDLILYKDDKGDAAERFLRERAAGVKDLDNKIMNLIFLRKAKDTDIDEKPSRFFGVFKELTGLVIKNFDREKHIIHAPENGIPTDWIVTVMLDIHYSKPHAVSFYACDKHNRHYAIDEYWMNGSPDDLADLIVRKKRIDGWNIDYAYIDPLSKGDNFMKNLTPNQESTFNILFERLQNEGIYLQVASKDKGSGIRNIRLWLEGVNKLPTLFFFKTLQSVENNTRGVVYDLQRVGFDDRGEVKKKDDDFFENLYRYTLVGVEWEDRSRKYYKKSAGRSADSWQGM